MNWKFAIAFALVALSGCGDIAEVSRADQCLRREIFLQCMASLPKGPDKTEYNDWDEVVDSCGRVALRLSYRPQKQIKMECRP